MSKAYIPWVTFFPSGIDGADILVMSIKHWLVTGYNGGKWLTGVCLEYSC